MGVVPLAGPMSDPAIRRWDDGATWIAHPEEALHRASHVLTVGEGVLVVEPVAFDGLEDLLSSVGSVDGVVVLMDRHTRDAATVAERHDAPVLAPTGFARVDAKLPAPAQPLEPHLEGSDWSVRTLYDGRLQQEAALWAPAARTLLVPEAVGTAWYYTVGDEPVGVHPMSRIRPPTAPLAGVAPRRLLVGHGHPLKPVPTGAFERALETARRRLPRAWARAAVGWIRRA